MAGIAIDRYAPLPLGLWWALSLTALFAWFIAWRRGSFAISACLILLAICALGGARHHGRWRVFAEDDLGRLVSETPSPLGIEAVVLENPRWRPAPAPSTFTVQEQGDKTQFDARVVQVRHGDQWLPVSGRTAVIVEGHLMLVRAGDRLRIFGQGQRLQPPLNPGEFDFAARERSERKLCRIWVEHPDAVTIVQRGSPFHPRRMVHAVRDRSDRLLWRYVGHNRAPLASALLLGSREQLDRAELEPFFVTGAMHVLAISGLHVGILAMGFFLLVRLGWVRRRTALVAAIVLFVFYAVLTGAKPPVVRATVLIVMMCIGRLLGRPALAFNTLAAAAIVVLTINPCELFDTGAQLSFVAVTTLTLAAAHVAPWSQLPKDPLDRLIVQTRPWPQRLWRRFTRRLAQLLAISAAVWLATLPLTMHRFHIVSTEAILLNLVLWAPVTLALFTGFAVLLLADLAPPLAQGAGAACDASLALFEGIIHTAHVTAPGHAWTPGPAAWWVLGSYAALAFAASFPQSWPRWQWRIAFASVWMTLGLSPPDWGFSRPPPPLHAAAPQSPELLAWSRKESDNSQAACTFIAVGHGVSVLVELPGGKTLLYDAGGLGPPTASARSIAAVLWSRGLRHIDAVVLSHADADHYNALPELLKRFSIGVVYVSPVMFKDASPPLLALRERIFEAGVPLQEIAAGDRLFGGEGAQIEILHPPPQGVSGGDNANSLVLHVEVLGRRILLPGDLEGKPLLDLLEDEPVGYDLALAPHHGSKRSTPPGFATWAKPQWIVISGSRSDISTEVRDTYRAAGSQVFHTAEDGAVRVTLRRDGVYLQTWRSEPRCD